MGPGELSKKKLKMKKKTPKNRASSSAMKSSELFHIEENLGKVKGEKKMKKSLEDRKRQKDNDQFDHSNVSGRSEKEIGRKKKIKTKKKNVNIKEAECKEDKKIDSEMEDGIGEEHIDVNEVEKQSKRKSKKKNKRNEKRDGDENHGASQSGTKDQVGGFEILGEASTGTNIKTRKAKKARKADNVEQLPLEDEQDTLDKRKEAEDDVYLISSGDEDSSKGMRRWIIEYHQNRPGLKELQERIDDFITDHEAQEEQARKEREAQAAEGGWTVVQHHKGRKKTTDAESGIAVGSVAQAAVLDKMAKKKSKDVGLDFYRFQKREAHRNEVMMLRSKFEQDRKRIQELRAQRKFRPY